MGASIHLSREEHLAEPWRVHALAHDFKLLDTWTVALEIDPERDRFEDFYRLLAVAGANTRSGLVNSLFAIRERVGAWFDWDAGNHTLPIPGCSETSVRERLGPGDLEHDRSASVALPAKGLINLRPVYLFEYESLSEISNSTVHALLHFGWSRRAPKPRAQIAVYIKSRGLFTDLYMASIWPARHLLVYPAWMKSIAARWNQRARP